MTTSASPRHLAGPPAPAPAPAASPRRPTSARSPSPAAGRTSRLLQPVAPAVSALRTFGDIGRHLLIPLFLATGMALAYLGAFHQPTPHAAAHRRGRHQRRGQGVRPAAQRQVERRADRAHRADRRRRPPDDPGPGDLGGLPDRRRPRRALRLAGRLRHHGHRRHRGLRPHRVRPAPAAEGAGRRPRRCPRPQRAGPVLPAGRPEHRRLHQRDRHLGRRRAPERSRPGRRGRRHHRGRRRAGHHRGRAGLRHHHREPPRHLGAGLAVRRRHHAGRPRAAPDLQALDHAAAHHAVRDAELHLLRRGLPERS